MSKERKEILDYLSKVDVEVLIEAELPIRKRKKFESDYLNKTGQPVPSNDSTSPYYVWENKANKWGLELRVYFSDNGNIPKSLRDLLTENSRLDDSYDKYDFRLNNVDIIMYLFENGFLLGEN